MFATLVKKQLMETFQSYFYNAKKSTKRSTLGTILCFASYLVLMCACIGGLFFGLSFMLCLNLVQAQLDWLYFAIMSLISVVMGAFGSVFNSYSALYLSKDNDLLLSLPIPAKYIIGSRLVDVYILGLFFSAIVYVPTLINYINVVGFSAKILICGLIIILCISLFVLVLSCILGLGVAKISVKLKNKSYITTIIALVFIGLYYFFNYKAMNYIQDFLENASIYGESIKSQFKAIYYFGNACSGSFINLLVILAISIVIVLINYLIIERSYFKLSIKASITSKTKGIKKTIKKKAVFFALVQKELARFTSSSNYMLNCGLGLIMLLAAGVVLLIKGEGIIESLKTPGTAAVPYFSIIVCTIIAFISSMVDLAAPSVSLEGKNVWVLQSLPVESKDVLRAKACLQIVLSAIPVLFVCISSIIVLNGEFIDSLVILIFGCVYTCFVALFDTFLSISFTNLNWKNELYPIKQSAPVAIAILGGVIISGMIMCGGMFLTVIKMNPNIYISIWIVVFTLLSILLLKYLDTKGAQKFRQL